MDSSNIPIMNIIDIIHIKRKAYRQTTYNKSCYVLSYRVSGESLFFYNNTSVTVKTGDILYIPCGSTYSQECQSDEIICFHLEAYSSLSDEILLFHNDNNENSYKICELFKTAYSEWERKEHNYKYKCMALLYEILSVCNINFIEQKNYPPIIKNAVNYLNDRVFDLDLSIEKLCKEANISRAYFNKHFKNAYGLTPVEYINNRRMEKAKFLLDSGNYTNEEIASLCGFNNIKYFYVVFKKNTGMTTKEYKSLDK